MRIITTENASASQTEHPWRAAIRTFIQAAIVAFPALLALPEIVKVVDEEFGEMLSSELRADLLILAGVVSAGSAALARIMAIPGVEKALRGIGLGAAPSEPNFGHWDGEPDAAEVYDLDGPDPHPLDTDDGDADPEGDADDEEPALDVPDDDERDADPEGPDDEAAAAVEVDLTPPPDGYEPRH